MFMGEYNHTVDAKGRLIVPAKFREALGEEFVVTKGLDGCLFVYPMEEWKNIEEKFRNIPLTTKDARKFSRFFFSGAATCEVDKQGRILIPSVLREFVFRKTLYWQVFSTGLKSGVKSAGWKKANMTIWTKLLNIWRSLVWVFNVRRRKWNLNLTNLRM